MSTFSDDRYEIQAKIGEGGVGAVYKAYDKQLKRDVAIKRVLPEGGFETQDDATEHLLKEATSVSSVQHPNIVTVFDSGVDADGPYVVMELLDGRTLDEMVERSILTLTDFKEVASQMQEALIAAQDLNLVHRDLKPSNVMVTWLPSGRFQVKIVDFGLAKFSAAPSLQTINHGDSVFGSIFFMAPEQFERTELDQRTDMYATGCLYYFCLTGEYPFSGETAAEVMEAHLNHTVRPLQELRPDAPDWLNDWVMWHVNRDMAHRPKNARESLEVFLSNERALPLAEAAQAPLPASAPIVQARAAVPKHTTASVPSATGSRLAFPSAKKSATQSISERIKTAAQTVTSRPGLKITAAQPIAPPVGKPASLHATDEQPVAPIAQPNPATATPSTPAPAGDAAPKLTVNSPRKETEPPKFTVNSGQKPVSVSVSPTATTAPAGTAPTPGVTPPTSSGAMPGHSPQQPAAPSAGGSVKIKIIIVAVLAVAVAIVGFFVVNRAKDQKQNERLGELLDQGAKATFTAVEMTGSEAELVLQRLQGKPDPSALANYYYTLRKAVSTDGSPIDTIIMDEVLEANTMPAVRKGLLTSVLGFRGSPAIIEPALKLAAESDQAAISAAAVTAVAKSATSDHVPALVSLMAENPHSATRLEAEKVIKRILGERQDVPYIAEQLAAAYELASNSDIRLAFLRTLGASGARQARPTIEEALASKEVPEQISALSAAGEWPDDSFYPGILELLSKTENRLVRAEGFKAAVKRLKADDNRTPADLEELWQQLISAANSDAERRTIVTEIVFIPGDWVLETLQGFVRDGNDSLAAYAEKAIDARKERSID